MIWGINFAEFIAGLGFFLLGMQRLETALGSLFGKSLRTSLRHHTRHPAQGILVGTVATAILQSSSLVTLILLAFVGAGILSLGNALGVVLGANLGTTFTGWLVTAIGFKLELDAVALPAIGIGALGVVFLKSQQRLGAAAVLLLGIGMLLFGLDLMTNSANDFAAGFDPSTIRNYSPLVFLAVGFGFTVVVQSSSAAMMANLSALSAGIIGLEAAAALAIGADLGTTVKVMLSALDATAEKRQVALAHFLFNVATTIMAFVLLQPLLWLVTQGFGISDPLFALVAFHSTFNLLGIVLFYPFLGRFAAFLENRFSRSEDHISLFIATSAVAVPEAAVESLDHETRHLVRRCIELNAAAIGISTPSFPDGYASGPPPGNTSRELGSRYEELKDLEGEMLGFVQAVQEQPLGETEAVRLAQLLVATRHAVHAAKAIKDIRHNLEAADAGEDGLGELLGIFRKEMTKIYIGIAELLATERTPTRIATISDLVQENEQLHDRGSKAVRSIRRGQLGDVELSTALNMNRELYGSNKALLSCLKELLLNPEDARELDDVAGLD